jgi:shikimate dehydrogenase
VQLLTERVKVTATFVPWEGDFVVAPETDVLVNATSVGLGNAAARLAVATDSFTPPLLVADVIFNPPETRLIRDAKAAGCTTLDGLGMLVNQAVIGFKIWTGVDADATVMRDALEEFLGI